MRPELNQIEIIEKFILGELSPENEQKVIEKIKNDPEFAEKVEKQRLLKEANQNIGIRETAQKSYAKFKWSKFLKFGLPLVILVAAVTYIATTMNFGSQTQLNPADNIKYLQNENGEEVWSDADMFVEPQFFTVNADEDNVIVGEDGTVVSIPGGALLDENGHPVSGEIEVELKEALNPMDIINAGLTTMSGEELLETGGMFYFNARQNGKNLKIDPSNELVVDVPANEAKKGMMLYNGVRNDDGSIDWQNPRELMYELTTVDIHSLDFYPPGYITRLGSMGYSEKDKAWTDSVYYSFGGAGRNYSYKIVPRRPMGRMTIEQALQLGIDPNTEAGNLAMERIDPEEAILLGLSSISDTLTFYSEAQTNYRIDPAKIKSIWNDKFQNTYIATREFEDRLKVLFQICGEEYLDLYIRNIDKPLYYTDSIVAGMICSGKESVEPAMNEFEDDLLPMGGGWLTQASVDSVTGISMGDVGKSVESPCAKFRQFAAQRCGGVKVPSEAVKALNRFYETHTKAQQQAASETQKVFWADYHSKKTELSKLTSEEQERHLTNQQNLYQEEYDLNLDEAYRQLGIEKRTPPRVGGRQTNRGAITTPGWKNIDRAVAESTKNRTTLDFTAKDGKKAIIKYEQFQVEVEDEGNYDRVLVYLLPKQLSSYQRVTARTKTAYTENLNELIQYDLLVVGYKGEEVSSHYIWSVQPGKEKISLQPTTVGGLKVLLEGSGKSSVGESIVSTVRNQITINALDQSLAVYKEMRQFRNEIARTIFPCDYFAAYMGVEAEVIRK